MGPVFFGASRGQRASTVIVIIIYIIRVFFVTIFFFFLLKRGWSSACPQRRTAVVRSWQRSSRSAVLSSEPRTRDLNARARARTRTASRHTGSPVHGERPVPQQDVRPPCSEHAPARAFFVRAGRGITREVPGIASEPPGRQNARARPPVPSSSRYEF